MRTKSGVSSSSLVQFYVHLVESWRIVRESVYQRHEKVLAQEFKKKDNVSTDAFLPKYDVSESTSSFSEHNGILGRISVPVQTWIVFPGWVSLDICAAVGKFKWFH